MKRIFSMLAMAAAALAVPAIASAAVYPGNGQTGFGGPVGGGSLEITDTPTSITFTLTRGPGDLNDGLAIYLDTLAGGV